MLMIAVEIEVVHHPRRIRITRGSFGDVIVSDVLPEIGGFVSGTDHRSPMSVGISLATRISSIGLEFALPMLLGYYLDVRLGTAPVLLLIGMALGFTIGVYHLVQIARDSSKPN